MYQAVSAGLLWVSWFVTVRANVAAPTATSPSNEGSRETMYRSEWDWDALRDAAGEQIKPLTPDAFAKQHKLNANTLRAFLDGITYKPHRKTWEGLQAAMGWPKDWPDLLTRGTEFADLVAARDHDEPTRAETLPEADEGGSLHRASK